MNQEIISKFEKYLRTKRKMNKDTVINYVYDIKAFSKFIEKDILKATVEDVDRYLEDKKKRGIGANRINFSISALCSFYGYARRGNHMYHNPMKNTKREKVEKKEEDDTYLNRYQISETKKKLEEHGDIQLMIYFGLLIASAPMRQIIPKLKWRDINWKKKYMCVKIDEERSCILYLDDYTIEKLQLLRKMRNKDGLKRGQIFITRYNGLNEVSDDTLLYWTNKIKKMMGFEKLTFSVIKRSSIRHLKGTRQFSDEKIELINSHRSFPTDLKEEILKEVEQVLNMK